MEIQAVRDVVIVRPDRQAEVINGIVIPPSEDMREDTGEIVACGPGRTSPKGVFIPISVKPGDRILFSTNGHQVTTLNGEELVVLREDSIMGVISG